MKLTIPQKAFLLVAVPLLVGVILTVSLAKFLHDVDVYRQKAAQARDMTSHLTRLLGYSFRQASFSGILYTLSDASDQWEKDLDDKVAREVTALEAFEKQPDVPADKLRHIIDLINLFNQRCKEGLNIIKQGDQIRALREWLKMQRILREVNANCETLMEEQRAVIAARQADESRARENLQIFLLSAFLADIVIALLLWQYFRQSIVKPLSVVAGNTIKIAAGKQLVPLPQSDTEIAQLNRVFLSMAEQIKNTRLRERAVLDDAVDIICSIDDGGRIVEINQAARAILDYDPEELLGMRMQQLVVDADAARVNEILAPLIEENGSASFECRLIGKTQRIRHTAWTVHGSARGKVIFSIVRDITKLKEVEQLKRDFVAMVSHDLRTPLTSIQMFHSILESGTYGDLSSEGMSKVATAEHNVELLLSLVNDLLELERMESGQFFISTTALDITRIFDDVYDSTIGFTERNKIKLITKLDETFPLIQADSGRITQVIVNLISNAVKFSAAGSQLTLTASHDANFAKIHVIDQGRGIPPELQATIFERFKQVSADDARVKKGAGLGLAICKAIVERHGGQIGVVSQPDQGSDFWFTVPLAVKETTS